MQKELTCSMHSFVSVSVSSTMINWLQNIQCDKRQTRRCSQSLITKIYTSRKRSLKFNLLIKQSLLASSLCYSKPLQSD